MIYLTHKIYLISGSPKCPIAGLREGEETAGSLSSLREKEFDSIDQ